MENKKDDGFCYTYSAVEQEEIKKIRDKYVNKEENKIERLRRLDARVTARAQTVALIIGVVGVLILGLGMSLIMSELGEIIGVHKWAVMPVGVIVGVTGVILVSLAYPVYIATIQRERKRIAPEIIRLSDELMKN